MFVATIVAALAVAAPAEAAAPPPKPIEIAISDKAFATPESRLCMPKDAVGKKRDRTVPKTMCHTRAEWEAQGVVFRTR
jgi:hypothetical protein